MILTSLLKKLKLNDLQILGVGILLSCIESFLPDIQTGNAVLDLFFGSFVTATQVPSHFTLFNWYIFVSAGMFFAQIIRRLPDQNPFYKRLLIISGVLMIVFILATIKFGMFFPNRFHRYYSADIVEAIGYLSIDFFLLSLFYFVVKRYGTKHLGVYLTMSKNLTEIYVIHWCILGLLEYILCYQMKFVFSYPVIYLFGFMILIAAYYISIWWNNRKQ